MLMLPENPARHGSDLLHMVRLISENLELDEVTRRCLKYVVQLLAGQGGIVALRDETGHFYTANELGIDPERRPIFERLLQQLVGNLSGQSGLVTNGETPVHNKAALEELLGQMARSLAVDWRHTIPIALSFEKELLGILFVFRSYHSEVSEFLAQALQTITTQAAIAIHHARLFQNIQQERQRLATLVKHSADGILILDTRLQIEHINPALERMTGWREQDAYGEDYEELLAWRTVDTGNLRATVASGWPFSVSAPQTLYAEGEITRRDGLPFHLGVTFAPLMREDGKALDGIIANVRDLTQARQAQEQQNLFISTISHELKTPVALIKGYANTLLRKDADWDPSTISEGLQVIDEEADRLSSLIENLLEASRIQIDEQLVLKWDSVNVPLLVSHLVKGFRKQSQRHDFSLRFSSDFPSIHADEKHLREIFENLLSNALKYSPAGGKVEIGGERRDDEVLLYVRDEGVGIDEREKERIFERFYRIDGNLSRETQGAGLGLYLAKAIVQAHHGRLHVRSKPGRGSIFYFTLPIQREG